MDKEQREVMDAWKQGVPMSEKVPLTVYVSPEQKRALKVKAAQEGKSMTELVVGSITQLTTDPLQLSPEEVPYTAMASASGRPPREKDPTCKCDHTATQHKLQTEGQARGACRKCGCVQFRAAS
jgi:plasmid stability protein